jgi:hypothetical protein
MCASQTAGSKLNEHYGEVYPAKLKIFLKKVGYFARLIDINPYPANVEDMVSS